MSSHFSPQLLLIWHLQDPSPTSCPSFRHSLTPVDCFGIAAPRITHNIPGRAEQDKPPLEQLVTLGLVPPRMCVKISKKPNQISSSTLSTCFKNTFAAALWLGIAQYHPCDALSYSFHVFQLLCCPGVQFQVSLPKSSAPLGDELKNQPSKTPESPFSSSTARPFPW